MKFQRKLTKVTWKAGETQSYRIISHSTYLWPVLHTRAACCISFGMRFQKFIIRNSVKPARIESEIIRYLLAEGWQEGQARFGRRCSTPVRSDRKCRAKDVPDGWYGWSSEDRRRLGKRCLNIHMRCVERCGDGHRRCWAWDIWRFVVDKRIKFLIHDFSKI